MRRTDRHVLRDNNRSSTMRGDLSSKQRTRRDQSLKSKQSSSGLANYKFIQFIGKGTFGKVYSAIQIKSQRKVAIKVVELYANYQNRQLDIIKRIKHPNCIQLEKHFVGFDQQAKSNKNYELTLYLVMEQLDFSLAKYIQIRRKRSPMIFSAVQLKVICFQLFKALDYLDGSQICHRDLKPQNILINGDTLQVKICDYGSAKIIEEGQDNLAYICSRYYRAPQLLFGHTKYTTAVDTWSLGCILMQLLTGEPVFPGESTIDQIIEIIKILGSPPRSFLEETVKMEDQSLNFPKIQSLKLQRLFGRYQVERSFIDLISKCLDYDWRKRIKPSQVFLHQFFDDLQDQKFCSYTEQLSSIFDFSKNLQTCKEHQRQQILNRFKSIRRTGSKRYIKETNENMSTEIESQF